MAKRKVTWTKRATRQMNAVIEYIRQESDKNADTVKLKILNKVSEISDDTVIHRKDPYKKNNDGNYLYVEIVKYRIVYYATPEEIFIIRLRHTSMEPKKY